MKQKDIAVIIIIAFISAIASFVVSGKLFVTPSNRQQKAEVVDPIDASFNKPSEKYFNSNSIDPARPSGVGGDTNQDPFNGNGR